MPRLVDQIQPISREQPISRKQSISRVDALLKMYALVSHGADFAAAQRAIHQRFDVESDPVTIPVTRVMSIINNGGYPVELVPDEIEVAVDEGVPEADHSVYSVITKGKVVDTFGVTREGDKFVVRTEDGHVLGKCSSKEKFMEILQDASKGLIVEELPDDVSRFDIIDIEGGAVDGSA